MSKTSKDRPRLGRGLSSLMGMGDGSQGSGDAIHLEVAAPPLTQVDETVPVSETSHEMIDLALSAIVANPHQPRKRFSDASLQELADSLKSTGLIQPIVVRRVGADYQLIAGERRWRAAKLAGLSTVPALVKNVEAGDQAQMALVENIQRENLNPIDRAVAYRRVMTQFSLTQAELASRLGEDRSSIANHLRLLELAEPVQNQVVEGSLTLGHAKVLASLSDLTQQTQLGVLCTEQGLSVRHLERLIAHHRGSDAPTENPSEKPAASAHVKDVEKSVARQLGMRVQLKSTPGKPAGRLVIHYASLDQFDDLLQRLGVQLD